MDSARALIARGWGVSLVSRCLRVSRAQLHVILRRTDDWMDGRRSRHTDDTDVLLRIHHVIGELPTYGYRRAEDIASAVALEDASTTKKGIVQLSSATNSSSETLAAYALRCDWFTWTHHHR